MTSPGDLSSVDSRPTPSRSAERRSLEAALGDVVVDVLPARVGDRRVGDRGAAERDAAAWDAYVESRTDATLYHLRAWRAVTEKAYGFDSWFFVARDTAGGPVRGVLPLFRIPRPGSPYLTTGPFGSYGPVLADEPRHGRALVRRATALVDEGRAKFLHMKVLGEHPPFLNLDRRDIWVTAKLDLDDSAEALWTRFPRSMRGKIRKAQREGLTSHEGASDLEAFYDVLGENMHRKGAPMYGMPFFRALIDGLAPRATVLTLRLGGRVVSAAFIAWLHDVMYVPFASSRPSVFSLCANNLLYWEIMRFAHERGLRTLDFGTSLRGTTALDFKKSFHARVEPVGSYLYARPGVTPALEPGDSRVARVAVDAWARLPRTWTDKLGPYLCRWIA